MTFNAQYTTACTSPRCEEVQPSFISPRKASTRIRGCQGGFLSLAFLRLTVQFCPFVRRGGHPGIDDAGIDVEYCAGPKSTDTVFSNHLPEHSSECRVRCDLQPSDNNGVGVEHEARHSAREYAGNRVEHNVVSGTNASSRQRVAESGTRHRHPLFFRISLVQPKEQGILRVEEIFCDSIQAPPHCGPLAADDECRS